MPGDLFKILGYIGAAVGSLTAIGGGLKWLWSVFNTVSDTNKTITTLATNHFPHLQDSVDKHSAALQEIKSDIRVMDTRLENQEKSLDDTRQSMKVLGEAFVKHIDSNREVREV